MCQTFSCCQATTADSRKWLAPAKKKSKCSFIYIYICPKMLNYSFKWHFHFSSSIFMTLWLLVEYHWCIWSAQCSQPPAAASVWCKSINVLRWKTDVAADICVPERRQIICEEQGRRGPITPAGSDLIWGYSQIRQQSLRSERDGWREERVIVFNSLRNSWGKDVGRGKEMEKEIWKKQWRVVKM